MKWVIKLKKTFPFINFTIIKFIKYHIYINNNIIPIATYQNRGWYMNYNMINYTCKGFFQKFIEGIIKNKYY